MGNIVSSILDARQPAHGHSDPHTKHIVQATTNLLEHYAEDRKQKNRRRRERGTADRKELERYRKMQKIYQETRDPDDLIRTMEWMGVRGPAQGEDYHRGR